jgi:hypothetical protein
MPEEFDLIAWLNDGKHKIDNVVKKFHLPVPPDIPRPRDRQLIIDAEYRVIPEEE